MADPVRVVVAGLIGQHGTLGGMVWHHLQYVVGLARMGHAVYYVEDSGEWPYAEDHPAGDPRSCAATVRRLAAVMTRFGLSDRWAFRCPLDGSWSGMSDARRASVLASADLLVNVSGSLDRPADYRAIPVLAYVDTDPVFTQIRLLRGPSRFGSRVDAHDVHFTFGERLSPGLTATGHGWRPTRQPIVLAEWTGPAVEDGAYTTVMSWSSYASESWRGHRYGQKDIEFQRFVDLPLAVRPAKLELAVNLRTPLGGWDGPPAEREEIGDLLATHGWAVANPSRVCGSLDAYRNYILSSRGEWTVAKNAYVHARSGWFSERSACYLAAGRPVVAQDTGFSEVLPTGEGLLTFNSPGEAAAAIAEVEADHRRHAHAARELAEAHFAADSVLSDLLDAAGAG
jgi:hypothetical protein